MSKVAYKHKVKINYSKLLLTIFGIIIGLMFAFPIYVIIITSFKPNTQIFDMKLWPDTFTLENYISVFVQFRFLDAVKNSLFIAVITTALSLFMQTTSAYAFSRLNFRGKNAMFMLAISTLMIPFTVLLIPLFLIVRSLGLADSLWGIIIPIAANGYGVFLMRQFFITIPKDLDESARIDGASFFTIYWRILLPLCKPILMTLGASYFISNWNNYMWPVIIINDPDKYVIQMTIAGFSQEHSTAWNLIFAGTVICSVPIFLLFYYFQKYIVEGIKTTGIKS